MSGRFRAECRRIIFEFGRWDEKAFDIVLIFTILFSVGVVLCESLPSLSPETRRTLYVLEWIIMIIGYGTIAVPTAIVASATKTAKPLASTYKSCLLIARDSDRPQYHQIRLHLRR